MLRCRSQLRLEDLYGQMLEFTSDLGSAANFKATVLLFVG